MRRGAENSHNYIKFNVSAATMRGLKSLWVQIVIADRSPFSRVICPTKFKNWRTLKSFWGIIYHICGVSLPPIPGHLELGGTQRIDILIKVILHCKMVQIGHFQRVIREVSRGCLMVPIILTCQDMSIFR